MANVRDRAVLVVAPAAVWAAAVLVVSVVAVAQAAVNHTVGGVSNGWTKPNGNTLPGTYLQDWASLQSFAQGDHLVFDYSPVVHNVLVVSLADYLICNALSPIAKYETGKDTVTVPAGPSFYICGTPTHCESGQKFNITAASTTFSSASAAAEIVPVIMQALVAAASGAFIAAMAL